MWKCLLTLGIAGLCAAQTSTQYRNSFANHDIVVLAKAGFSEEFILDAISGARTHFETTADDLAALAREGISETIIRAMMKPPAPAAARPAPLKPLLKVILFFTKSSIVWLTPLPVMAIPGTVVKSSATGLADIIAVSDHCKGEVWSARRMAATPRPILPSPAAVVSAEATGGFLAMSMARPPTVSNPPNPFNSVEPLRRRPRFSTSA